MTNRQPCAADTYRHGQPSGFTLVELLVVIAIIGVLVAMMIPAVQASRETANRNQCLANMSQLVLALQNYENSFETFPAGVRNPDGPIRSEATGLHQGFMIDLLPYLDEQPAYRLIDPATSVYDKRHADLRAHWPRVFICPAEVFDDQGNSSYAGCHHDVEAPIDADNHGVLFLNSRVRREDVTDGLSHTLFLGEKRFSPEDLGWMSGTRATLRNTGRRLNDVPLEKAPLNSANAPDDAAADARQAATHVGGFAGAHSMGSNLGFGDGSARFVSEEIDLSVWQQLGHRSDGKLLDTRLLGP